MEIKEFKLTKEQFQQFDDLNEKYEAKYDSTAFVLHRSNLTLEVYDWGRMEPAIRKALEIRASGSEPGWAGNWLVKFNDIVEMVTLDAPVAEAEAPAEEKKQTFTVREAAEYKNCAVITVHRAHALGFLRGEKPGGHELRFSREDLDNWTVLRRGGKRAGAGRKNESHQRTRAETLNEKLGYVYPIDGIYPHDRPELTVVYKDDYEGEDENGIGWSRVWLVSRFANRSKPGMSFSASLMRVRWILTTGQSEWGGLHHAACEDHIMRGDEYQKIADWIDWQDSPDNPENKPAYTK